MKYIFITLIMCLAIIVSASSLGCTVTPSEPPISKEYKVELYCRDVVIKTWIVDQYPTVWRSTTNIGFREKTNDEKIEIIDLPQGCIIISEI